MKKVVIAWLALVLGLVALFAWVGKPDLLATSGQESGEVLIKADFSLVGEGDKIVTAESLRGHYLLVYFGFAHCPDICPTALLLIGNALNKLGDQGKNLKTLFITVDPERDTPQKTSDYAKRFHTQFIGLSGTRQQIDHATEAFKVFASKVPTGAEGEMQVDHSSFIYLMDPHGRYVTHFASSVSEQELTNSLQKYVK